ncbi:MAG: phosphate transport system permease protein, partial [Thalassolituus oleivorans]
MFQATILNEQNDRVERRYRRLFLMMTVLLVLPVLIILTLLIVRGAPAISLEFL